MLTTVEARNDRGALLSFPLQDPSSAYQVKDITGLNPVNATIVSSKYALLDGARYQSSRRETRNIVMTLGFSPDYVTASIKELRQDLYSMFMPKSSVKLSFVRSIDPTVLISGRVESFEAVLFTKEPEVVISVLCFNPDFYIQSPIIVTGNTVADGTLTSIDYGGTIETGLIFRLYVNRSLNGFTIYHSEFDGTIKTFEIAAAFIAGDVVEVDMTPGSKNVTRIRAGVYTSILYSVAPVSEWVKLYSGLNSIRVYAIGAAIPYTIEYTLKFGGL